MKCHPNVKFLCQVPDLLIKDLMSYVEKWDYQHQRFKNFNRAFGFHHCHEVKISDLVDFNKIKTLISWLTCEIYPQTTPVQIMFNCLKPRQRFPLHVDTLTFHQLSHRIHIPLSTTDCDYYHLGSNQNDLLLSALKFGNAYEFNNIDPHCVENSSDQWRINFIVDLIPLAEKTLNLKKVDVFQLKKLKDIENFTNNNSKFHKWRLCLQ